MRKNSSYFIVFILTYTSLLFTCQPSSWQVPIYTAQHYNNLTILSRISNFSEDIEQFDWRENFFFLMKKSDELTNYADWFKISVQTKIKEVMVFYEIEPTIRIKILLHQISNEISQEKYRRKFIEDREFHQRHNIETILTHHITQWNLFQKLLREKTEFETEFEFGPEWSTDRIIHLIHYKKNFVHRQKLKKSELLN